MIKSTNTARIYPSPFIQNMKQYAIKAHADCNQMYDEYIDYQFHLRMVVKNGENFIHLIPDVEKDNAIAGCWGHDLIEDTRENYNAVKSQSNVEVAEIVRCCTNYGRGRNRDERMPDWLYEEIKANPSATFVKLCDRMANAQYSKMTGSQMYDKYIKEHAHFKKMLYTPGYLEEMWKNLEEIFGINN